MNNLDVLVSYVRYDDQFRQVRLFDEYGDVIAHVELRNITRKEWLLDEDGHTVVTVELAQPTDPLPVYVAALKEALVGSSVQSVSASDGGLCLHLDDDYDAVTNGVLRLRVGSERVPFTVGDVFVNRGGTDFTLCICTQTERKSVVAFKIDRDALERKELSLNVI